MGVGTGLAFVLSGGVNVPFVPRVIQTGFGALRLEGLIPVPIVLVFIIAIVCWYVMNSTRFGLRTLAIGSMREGGFPGKDNVRNHVLSLFVLMGHSQGSRASWTCPASPRRTSGVTRRPRSQRSQQSSSVAPASTVAAPPSEAPWSVL